jgi:hypothetical protein
MSVECWAVVVSNDYPQYFLGVISDGQRPERGTMSVSAGSTRTTGERDRRPQESVDDGNDAKEETSCKHAMGPLRHAIQLAKVSTHRQHASRSHTENSGCMMLAGKDGSLSRQSVLLRLHILETEITAELHSSMFHPTMDRHCAQSIEMAARKERYVALIIVDAAPFTPHQDQPLTASSLHAPGNPWMKCMASFAAKAILEVG